MSAPSPPAPPDPQVTAAAQTGTNVNTAIANAMLANRNTYGPYGSTTYEVTGQTWLPNYYNQTPGTAPGGAAPAPAPAPATGGGGAPPANSPDPVGKTGSGFAAQQGAGATLTGGINSPGWPVNSTAVWDNGGPGNQQPDPGGGGGGGGGDPAPGDGGPSSGGAGEPAGWYIPQYAVTTQLSPAEQAVYDQQVAARQALAGGAAERAGFLANYLQSSQNLYTPNFTNVQGIMSPPQQQPGPGGYPPGWQPDTAPPVPGAQPGAAPTGKAGGGGFPAQGQGSGGWVPDSNMGPAGSVGWPVGTPPGGPATQGNQVQPKPGVNAKGGGGGFPAQQPAMGADGQITRLNPANMPTYNQMGQGPQMAGVDAAARLQQNFGPAGGIRRGYQNDFSADRQRVEDALFERLENRLGKDREAMESRLANQGFTLGSEGYSRERDRFAQAANDARLSAILGAGQEQSRLAGLAADEARFGNQAQAQAYGQALGRGQFANQARTGNLQNQIASQRFNNAAAQQAMQNQRSALQYNNQLQDQGWNNLRNVAAFNNQTNFDVSRNQMAATQANNAIEQMRMQAAMTQRNQPINEVTALMSGAQVNAPSPVISGTPTMPNVDYAGLVNDNYQARLNNWQTQQAQRQSLFGGMLGLGGSLLSGGLFG